MKSGRWRTYRNPSGLKTGAVSRLDAKNGGRIGSVPAVGQKIAKKFNPGLRLGGSRQRSPPRKPPH
jgi:hypothetical protein